MFRKIYLGISSLFASALLYAASGINVTPLIVDFSPTGAKFSDISVINMSSSSTAYVKVTLTRVDNPGMPTEKNIPFTNNPQTFGLVASPVRLAIPPSQLRRIRLLPLIHDNAQDVVYEVNITPVTGEMESFNAGNQIQAGLQVIVGYATKVFIRPLNAQAVVSITREGNLISISNTGNSNVLLNNGEECSSPSQCSPLPLPTHRLYSGNTWTFNAPNAEPVQFEESFINGQTKILKSS